MLNRHHALLLNSGGCGLNYKQKWPTKSSLKEVTEIEVSECAKQRTGKEEFKLDFVSFDQLFLLFLAVICLFNKYLLQAF